MISLNGPAQANYDLKKNLTQYKNYASATLKNKTYLQCIGHLNEYPIIQNLFKIISCITVTTASAERSFSKLKLIKTDLRNKMAIERLTNEGTISINRSYDVDLSKIVEIFCERSNLRIIV